MNLKYEANVCHVLLPFLTVLSVKQLLCIFVYLQNLGEDPLFGDHLLYLHGYIQRLKT